MALKIILLLNIVNMLDIVTSGFMIPLWSNFVHSIGGNIETAGKAVAIFSLVIAFTTFIAGRIISHFQRDAWFMVVTQLVRVVAYTGYFFVSSPLELYLVQIFLGLAGAFQAPALYGLYQHAIPKRQAPFYWSIWIGIYHIAIAIGAFISTKMVYYYGFTQMFVVLSTIASIGLITAGYTRKQLSIIQAP